MNSIKKMRQNRPTKKSVVQYDLPGNKIREWISISEAGRQLSLNSVGISRCCRGKQRTVGQFVFKFKGNYIPFKQPSKAKFTAKQRHSKLVERMSKTYEVTLPSGHKVAVKNLKAFCVQHKLNYDAMRAVACGSRPHHKQFKVKNLTK